MYEYHLKIQELMKLSPYPFRNQMIDQNYLMYELCGGEPGAIDWLKVTYEDALELVREGKGIIPGGERLRLADFFSIMEWKLKRWLEREQRVAVCANPIFHWGPDLKWDYDDPLETLADIYINAPSSYALHGPADYYIENAVEDCISYHADAVIVWVHAYCHEMAPLVRLLKDAVAERVGIPAFAIECDNFDPTFITLEELKERFENILESLEAQSR
jgi:hypothetical protein